MNIRIYPIHLFLTLYQMTLKNFSIALALFAIVACKKNTSSTNSNVPKTRVYLSTKRVLQKSVNIYDEIPRAEATEDGVTYKDMGQVQYGDSILFKPSNNRYVCGYMNPNRTTGWSNFLNGGIKWTISGNSASGIPSYTTTTFSTFPSIFNTSFPSVVTVDKNNPYTVTWDVSTPPDSVLVRMDIYTPSTGKQFSFESGLMKGNVNSYTFPASLLQQVTGAGSGGSLQIVGFIEQSQTIGDVAFKTQNLANLMVMVDMP